MPRFVPEEALIEFFESHLAPALRNRKALRHGPAIKREQASTLRYQPCPIERDRHLVHRQRAPATQGAVRQRWAGARDSTLLGSLNRVGHNKRARRVDHQPADKPSVQVVPHGRSDRGDRGEDNEPDQRN
jgi:hypothetical protein